MVDGVCSRGVTMGYHVCATCRRPVEPDYQNGGWLCRRCGPTEMDKAPIGDDDDDGPIAGLSEADWLRTLKGEP